MILALIGAALAISTPFIVNAIVDNVSSIVFHSKCTYHNHLLLYFFHLKQLRLVPGTVMYKFWEESPVPMYIRFYFFNVTNSEDVVKFNAKPILEELGPYTYS